MDKVIQRALQEEQTEKQKRKASKTAQSQSLKADRKGKTLAEIEDEEGGPVRESMIGMAHLNRAAKRKGEISDAQLLESVEQAEEELEVEEEEGIQFEAFNLIEERRRGHFDDAGNYVEHEDKEEKEAVDAWLASEEAKVIDEKLRSQIEEKQRRFAEAEAAPPLTAIQIARIQMQISQLLEEGETVSMALRRLGKHSRSRPQKRRKKEGNEEIVENKSDEETRVKFNTLVEAASSLIDAGETDVYDQERSYFQRCASVYIDTEGLEGPSNLLSRGISEAAYEEANQDMFADEDDTETGQHEASGHSASLGGKPITKGEDFASWSVKVLKQYLTDKGIDIRGIVEKEELVSKAKSCGPPGYDYDPNSGMWYSSESEMYWDPKSGGFWNPRDQKWYTYSEGGWVPWD